MKEVFEKMIKACSKGVGKDIKKRSRVKTVCYARYVYYHYGYNSEYVPSNAYLGDLCGKRDHATVLAGRRVFENLKAEKKEEFIRTHNACVREINKLDILPFIDELESFEIKTYNNNNEKPSTLRELKNMFSDVFITKETREDIKNLTTEQLIEIRELKFKPHLQMLKSRKHYATK